jgi:hypothetical protein
MPTINSEAATSAHRENASVCTSISTMCSAMSTVSAPATMASAIILVWE